MKTKRVSQEMPNQISPLLEKASASGDGYFGFTCFFADGKFKNVLVHYQRTERESSLQEINQIRTYYLQSITKGD